MNRFRQLFEEKKVGFIQLFMSRPIADCNQTALDILGYSNKDNLREKFLNELIFNQNAYHHLINQLNQLGILSNYPFLAIRADGKTVSLIGNFSLTLNKEGELQVINIFFREYSELTEVNENSSVYESSSAGFKKFVDNSPLGILVFTDYRLIYSNAIGDKLYREQLNASSTYLFEVFPEHLTHVISDLIKDARNNTNSYTEISLDTEINEKKYSINVVKVQDATKEAIYFILTDLSVQHEYNIQKVRAEIAEEVNKKLSEEIKRHKQTQLDLEKNTSKLNALFESSGELFLLTVDKDLKITSFNGSFRELTQKYLSDSLTEEIDFLETYPVNEKDYGKIIKKIKRAMRGESVDFINEFIIDEEKSIWIESFISPIRVKGEEINEIAFIAHDISDKVENDRSMIQSFKEKEVLLKEVHHRVKNNLQVISSILNLQSSYVEDEKTLEIINESQNRIRTMSFIHESLYQTTNFSTINFHDYITTLVQNLVHSYQINANKTNLILEVDKIDLVLDQAIPCGLILNELVSNSFKYAYPTELGGDIIIKINLIEGKIELRVEDNGVGLPEGFNIEESDSLGLGLVDTLVHQLDGELSLKTVGGTKYLITFEKEDF
jgi:two-component sensor histidine kinase